MIDPLFWLGLSILLVAISLAAVLVAALPALQELSRAARSAEKLFDTLRREFPPALEALRLTGLEISELTDEVNEGVRQASNVVKQIDSSVTSVQAQAEKVSIGMRGVFVGVRAAWKTWQRPRSKRRSAQRLQPSQTAAFELHQQGIPEPLTPPPQTPPQDEGKEN